MWQDQVIAKEQPWFYAARAWGVHPERVRSLPGFQPQLLASTMIDTPTAALSTAAPSDTSSAAAPSEMFDAGSDSGTEESDMVVGPVRPFGSGR